MDGHRKFVLNVQVPCSTYNLDCI